MHTFFENRDLCIAKKRFGFLIVIDNNIIITLLRKVKHELIM